MKLLQRWKQTSIHNKALVWTSVLVAFGTLFYAGAAAWQICLMKQSADSTERQIKQIIANANWIARKVDDSSQKISQQAADTHDLAAAAGKQADAAKALADLTAKQFVASQQVVESQRASIGVEFVSVLNPITFHDGGLSLAFSVALRNNGRLPANKVKVRFKPYFSQWGKQIFSEPMERQRDFCSAPNVSRDSRTSLRGLTNEDAFTIVAGDTKPWQINFGMGAPTESEIIEWPPPESKLPQTKRVYPIVVGCVDYQSGVMTKPHQTGFIFEIQRGDPRMPSFITLEENVPRENVIVTQYSFGQGKNY